MIHGFASPSLTECASTALGGIRHMRVACENTLAVAVVVVVVVEASGGRADQDLSLALYH